MKFFKKKIRDDLEVRHFYKASVFQFSVIGYYSVFHCLHSCDKFRQLWYFLLNQVVSNLRASLVLIKSGALYFSILHISSISLILSGAKGRKKSEICKSTGQR